MTSTSCKQIAEEVFEKCLAGHPPKKLPRPLVEEPCAASLFGIVVEGLADRFEPALVDTYAHLFAEALSSLDPRWNMVSLLARYERIRRPRPVAARPQRVVVLSRITLGADVAVTSVLIAAAKRRFPHAEIIFAGPSKNYELWLISDRLQNRPRSLGVIGSSDFTARPVLSGYDTDVINGGTYAVTVEQSGGSPDGAPHSQPVFIGKLIETVPAR